MIPGYESRVTESGHRIIRLHYSADPAKRDPQWIKAARARAASESDWQREMEINFSVTGGTSVYPEVAKFGMDKYLYEPRHLLDMPVIRGWDLGGRSPAVIWSQYSQTDDRWYVLREWCPDGIGAHHLRDVAMWLSGQVGLERLDQEATEWAMMLARLPGGPKPPWFAPSTQFMDFAGTFDATLRQSIAWSSNPREATLRDVWAAAGIQLDCWTGPVKARVDILRRFLYPRADGWPGLLISPSCGEVQAMLNGGLAYQQPTKANPKPEQVRKDGRHDDTHDALTYAMVSCVAAEGVPGVSSPAMPQETEEDLGYSYE